MDRIDPAVGYVPGNTQIIAGCLNRAKGAGKEIPTSAINFLWRRIERTKFDSLSRAPGTGVDQ